MFLFILYRTTKWLWFQWRIHGLSLLNKEPIFTLQGNASKPIAFALLAIPKREIPSFVAEHIEEMADREILDP